MAAINQSASVANFASYIRDKLRRKRPTKDWPGLRAHVDPNPAELEGENLAAWVPDFREWLKANAA
jgi:hypothetical protein